jgi:hypothetical protein
MKERYAPTHSQFGMAIDALQVSHPHDDILVVTLAMHGPGALTVQDLDHTSRGVNLSIRRRIFIQKDA